MTHQLFVLGKQALTESLTLPAAWYVKLFLTETSTPTPGYTTADRDVEHPSEITAGSDGRLPAVYLDPAITYKCEVYNSADVLQYTVDPCNDDIIPYPILPSEDDNVVDSRYAYGDFRRYYSGGDITSAVQTACDIATYRGRVIIPAGDWDQSGTVTIPMAANGSFNLEIQAGASIAYSGNSYAYDASTVAVPYANVNITGEGEIIGTSSGLAGIRYYCFNKGYIGRVRVRGFTNGDGVLIQGANTITCEAEVVGNENGVRLVSKLDGVQYAANACIIAGHVNNNSAWGVFEDASGDGGTNLNNTIVATFDPNGANGAGSGNIFIQGGGGTVISAYLEYSASQYGQYNVKLGDGTYHPVGTVIRDCEFASVAAVTASIYDNGTRTIIDGNKEVGVPTNFILGGADGVARYIGPNYAPSAGTFHGGTDNGDTLSVGNPSANIANMLAPTATGVAAKTLTGSGAALKIRARDSGDTTIADFLDFGGSTVARIGAVGSFKFGAAAVASLPAAASFQDFVMFATDANATTQNSIVAGGGANRILVYSDGTNWRIV